MLEKSHEYKDSRTSSQFGTKLRTDEKIGETYSLSRNTIARYLRINQLIPELRSKVDTENIPFITGVTLSFLKEDEQVLLNDCMECDNLSVNIKKANMLRQLSEKGNPNLNVESIRQVLSGEINSKPKQISTVKVSKEVFTKYFKASQSTKEIQKIIEKALEMYFNQQ